MSSDILCCPKCHKPALRLVPMPQFTPAWEDALQPSVEEPQGDILEGDEAVETYLLRRETPMVAVLTAPNWRMLGAFTPANTHNLGIGCPYQCGGRIVLFK